MKKIVNFFFAVFVVLFLSGCLFLNDRGISTKFYNDCKEYYDANGTYQKSCPKNIIGWSK
ncbi:MAG: hypothetical protein ACTTJC_02815 [Campylobacter sp.]